MFLPLGENSYSKILYVIFTISLCLLPFSTSGGTGSNSFVMTFAFLPLLILSIYIIYHLTSKKRINSYPKELKFTIFSGFLYAFSIILTSLLNQSIFTAFARSVFHVFGFTIFLYIISSSRITKNAIIVYHKISLIFVLSGCVMSAYFIVNFMLSLQQNSLDAVLLERENGGLMSLPWGATNTIAACLMMPLFIAVQSLFNNAGSSKKIILLDDKVFLSSEYINVIPKQNSMIMSFAVAISVAAIIITQSRNVLINVTIAMLLIGILTNRTKLMLIFFTIVTVAFLVVTTLYSQDLESIFSARIGDGAQDIGGFNGRTSMWDLSILYFLNHPFQPLGYFGMIGELGYTGHNILITTLIEQGIIGVIAYLMFVINNFKFCFGKIFNKYLSMTTKKTMIIYLVAMLSILTQLQFEDSNLTAQNIVYQWIFLALMYLSAYCDVSDKDNIEKYRLVKQKLLNPAGKKMYNSDS